MIQYCKNCKSLNVLTLKWVNVNNNKINNNLDPGVYTEWCSDCGKETIILRKENFSSLEKEILHIMRKNDTCEIPELIIDKIKTMLINIAEKNISSNDDHSNIIEFIKIKNFLEENLPQI